jgi:hypothetical protein
VVIAVTKILLVSGNKDESARRFDEGCSLSISLTPEEAYKLAEENGGIYDLIPDEICFQAYEFNFVPIEFIDFIRLHIQDEDSCHETDFYVIEP